MLLRLRPSRSSQTTERLLWVPFLDSLARTPAASSLPSPAPTPAPPNRLRETTGEARELLLAKPTKENEARLDSLLRESMSSFDE
jgi:hypothetical protein